MASVSKNIMLSYSQFLLCCPSRSFSFSWVHLLPRLPQHLPRCYSKHRLSLLVCWSSLPCLVANRLNQTQQMKHVFTRLMAVTYCKFMRTSGVLQLVCETDITHYQQNFIIKILILKILSEKL